MITIQKRRQEGFTIVELLIVIAVIAILALLVVTTYSGIQSRSRNSQRQADVAAIQTQLEAFYATNSAYPSAAQFSDANWRSANNIKIDVEALRDPSGEATALRAGEATDDQYGLVALEDGAACETAATEEEASCTSYTLYANLEGEDDPYTKTSLD